MKLYETRPRPGTKAVFFLLSFSKHNRDEQRIIITMWHHDFESLVKQSFLNLCDKNLTDYDLEELAKELPHSSTVKYLWLYRNRITSVGATTLADAIDGNIIKTLDLSYNVIGDVGVKALAAKCNGIGTLYLKRCGVTAAGGTAILDGLKDSLESLNLCGNRIGDTGITHMSKVLPQCHQLKWLYIGNIGLTKDGAKALVRGLSQSPSIITAFLSNGSGRNGLSDKNMPDALAEHSQMQRLNRFKIQRLQFSPPRNEKVSAYYLEGLLNGGEFEFSFLYLTLRERIDLLVALSSHGKRCRTTAMECTLPHTNQDLVEKVASGHA